MAYSGYPARGNMSEPCTVKELKGKKYRCYFELALQVIEGKWKPIILFHLARTEIMRFSELRRSMAGVTDRMLARQLRELEKDGLLRREVFREVPPRVEYSLTPLGCGMAPVLMGLRQWGVGYEAHLGGADHFPCDGYESAEPVQLIPRCQALLNQTGPTGAGDMDPSAPAGAREKRASRAAQAEAVFQPGEAIPPVPGQAEVPAGFAPMEGQDEPEPPRKPERTGPSLLDFL